VLFPLARFFELAAPAFLVVSERESRNEEWDKGWASEDLETRMRRRMVKGLVPDELLLLGAIGNQPDVPVSSGSVLISTPSSR
jgi:hypothetical protein